MELTPNREYMLVTEFFEDSKNLGDSEIDDTVIDEGLRLIRQFWDIGVAHRDIKPANLLVQRGHLQLVDVSGLEVRPTPWRQAVDLANMMLTLALQTDPDRVYERATAFFTPDEIAEAFACAVGMAIPTELSGRLKQDPRPIMERFKELAPPHAPVSIQTWDLQRIALTAAVVVGASSWSPWRSTRCSPGWSEAVRPARLSRLPTRPAASTRGPSSWTTPTSSPVGSDDRERTVDRRRREDPAVRGGDRLFVIEPHAGRCATARSNGSGDPGRPGSVASSTVERPDRGASQRREVSAAPEGRPHVGREHPDVGAAAAGDDDVDVVAATSEHLEAVDHDRAGGGLEHLPLPGGFVELATPDLDGREGGRPLHRLARRALRRPPASRSSSTATGADPDHLTVGIEGRGLDAEAHRGLVRLRQIAEEPQEPGGPADAHDEQSGRHRVEGARVARPSSCRAPRRTFATASCDVMPPRLVDEQQPFGSAPGRGGARLTRSTGSPRSGLARRSIGLGRPMGRGVPGREPVPAAAEGRRDPREVVVAARAHAHLEAAVLLLLHDRRDVDVARRSDHVDQVVGLGRVHARVLQVGLGEVGPDQVGVGDVLEPPERHADERQVGGGDCPRRAPAQAGRDRRGVRGAGQRCASVSGVVASYWNLPVSVTRPAYRQTAVSSGISPPIVSISRKTISQVDEACRIVQRDRAEALVRPMVVDPDHLARPVRDVPQLSEPVERGAVARDHHRGLLRERLRRHQPVGPGQQLGPPWWFERLVRVGADGLDPPRSQEGGEAQHRPEGVRVGIHVTRERDLGRVGEHLRRRASKSGVIRSSSGRRRPAISSSIR